MKGLDLKTKNKSKVISIDDQKEQLSTNTQPITGPKSILAVDRNRWFLAVVGLIMVCMVLAVTSLVALGQKKTVEIYWVKMQPSGQWEVQAPKADSEVEFYPATIEHFLGQWVESRYSENRHEIMDHYGFAASFMSPELNLHFKDPKRFNAVKKAADIKSCTTCKQVKVIVRDFNHNDSIRTTFGREEGYLYRSDVYISKQSINSDGTPSGAKTHHIVPIKWRLKPKGEIQADLLNDGGLKRLRANPVGIEILDYKLLNEKAQR